MKGTSPGITDGDGRLYIGSDVHFESTVEKGRDEPTQKRERENVRVS